MTAGYLPSAPSWQPVPWDICGRPQGHLELCLHTTCAGAASSFCQELPGMGTDTLHHLTDGAGKQLPQSDGSPAHPWDLKALALGFFVDRKFHGGCFLEWLQ